MIIRELVTKLGFEVNDKAIARYEKGFKSLRNTVLAVSGAVAGAATGLFFIAKSAADTADDLEELSQKSGMNAEALQEFQFSAKQAGVEAEGFSTGLKFLNKNIYEAQKGSEGAADAFNDLFGQGFDSSKFKSNQELLYGIADKFKTMPDGARKTAIAMQIFGKSGSEMIPFLNQGSEAMKKQGDKARALGAIMSIEAIKKSAAFSDTLKELTLTVIGIKNTLGAELAPVLNEIAQDFESWWMQEENRKAVKEGLIKFAKTMGDLLKDIATRLPAVVDGLTKFIDKMGGLQTAFWLLFNVLIAIKSIKFAQTCADISQGLKLMGTSATVAKTGIEGLGGALGALGAILFSVTLITDSFRSLGEAKPVGLIKWVIELRNKLKESWEFLYNIVKLISRMNPFGGALSDAGQKLGWWKGIANTLYGKDLENSIVPLSMPNSSETVLNNTKSSQVVNNRTTVSGTKIEVKVATDADPQTIAKEIKKSFSEFMANETANASMAVEGSMY